jgi:DNA polymerase (family X)
MLCYHFPVMSNQEISLLFRNIAATYAIKNEKQYHFQIIAYQNASEIIKDLTFELKELYKQNKLSDLPGIGNTIKSHLEELFETGKVKYFNQVQKSIPKAVFTLLNLPTFGPKKAYRLAKEFHLSNPETAIDRIKQLALSNKISKLDGFGEKSQADILQAIEEYEKNSGKQRRMNLPYAMETADKLIAYLKVLESVEKIDILGSLRRKKETIGDIDIAVATKNPKIVLDYFTKYSALERVLEKGDTTASILISGGVQIDLMTQPPKSYGSLLQHLTGSKEHNVKLREMAMRKGLSLSEYGIKKKGKIESFDDEVDFYNSLGMEWIPPEIRENQGEIELSLKHKLPRLIEAQDIKGDLHIHSSFQIEPSHDLGHDSVNDIIAKAIDLRYEYIGFSEHNPSASKHSKKQIYELLSKRNELIEQKIKSNKNIRAFKLLEVDILSNGSIPIDDKSLSVLDGVIVSVHSSFNQDKKEMTRRILCALSHPKARILGHPTGRLLGERPSFNLEWDEIFDFCKKNNKALEINSSPKRLDPPDSVIRSAIKQGVKFIINTDSHALWQMNLIKYGIFIARRGWATKDDILNTLSYNEFNQWLKGGEN